MGFIHETALISTLVMGLSAAFVGGMITSKLHLSPIVGYLLAGILIGPFTPGFIADAQVAAQLADIGIVLLMFGVGLHFSLKDLMEVKGIAVPGAIGQIVVATGLGAWITHSWGWPLESCLLFGLSLSVASTVVLLRSLEEASTLHSINGHVAVGWLIVEDLVIVLVLVLIPALSPDGPDTLEMGNFSLAIQLGIAVGKIILFMLFMLIAGKRILPWILTLVARTHSRELFTLSVFVVAVGVAFGSAYLFGISFALGAFFAGMMIKKSRFASEVTEKVLPFQDAFTVLFFVSVGMLFNPAILIEEPLNVIAIVLIIMVGKSIAAFGIVLLFRYSARTALNISASLAQIGEFSFILGAIGMTYGLLSEEANNLILAGSLISITLNPLAFKFINLIYTSVLPYPKMTRWLSANSDRLSHINDHQIQSCKNPVILVGYGHFGKNLVDRIKMAGIDVIVIEMSRRLVESMREEGICAVMGDAAFIQTLQKAGIDKAKSLVISIQNPYNARRIIKAARELKPDIEILIRAHTDEELSYFNDQNVDLVATGRDEVARRMTDYLHLMMKRA